MSNKFSLSEAVSFIGPKIFFSERNGACVSLKNRQINIKKRFIIAGLGLFLLFLPRLGYGEELSHVAEKKRWNRVINSLKEKCKTDSEQCTVLANGLIKHKDIGGALNILETACFKYHYARQCIEFAEALIVKKEKTTKDNKRKAILAYEKGCELDASYCDGLGFQYHHAYSGVPRDLDKAASLYKKSCDKMISQAKKDHPCIALASLYFSQKKYDDTISVMETFCETYDFSNAHCLSLAYAYQHKTNPENDKAISIMEKICNKGVKMGCEALGGAYEVDSIVKKDIHKAHTAFLRSCPINLKRYRCISLFGFYRRHREVNQYLLQLVNIFKEGCDDNRHVFCALLGELYMKEASNLPVDKNGNGKKEYVQIGFKLIEKTCQDNDLYCYYLAKIYQYGVEEIQIDLRKTMIHYETACKNILYLVYQDSCEIAGDLILFFNEGKEKAIFFYQRGCTFDSPESLGACEKWVKLQLELGNNKIFKEVNHQTLGKPFFQIMFTAKLHEKNGEIEKAEKIYEKFCTNQQEAPSAIVYAKACFGLSNVYKKEGGKMAQKSLEYEKKAKDFLLSYCKMFPSGYNLSYSQLIGEYCLQGLDLEGDQDKKSVLYEKVKSNFPESICGEKIGSEEACWKIHWRYKTGEENGGRKEGIMAEKYFNLARNHYLKTLHPANYF